MRAAQVIVICEDKACNGPWTATDTWIVVITVVVIAAICGYLWWSDS